MFHKVNRSSNKEEEEENSQELEKLVKANVNDSPSTLLVWKELLKWTITKRWRMLRLCSCSLYVPFLLQDDHSFHLVLVKCLYCKHRTVSSLLCACMCLCGYRSASPACSVTVLGSSNGLLVATRAYFHNCWQCQCATNSQIYSIITVVHRVKMIDKLDKASMIPATVPTCSAT